MRVWLFAGLVFAVVAAGTARACDEGRIVECTLGVTYCAVDSAGEGEWITYQARLGPDRTPRVPGDNELVLVFVEVDGGFEKQRMYSMGSFGDCFWKFENAYVQQTSKGRRILSWKRLDEPQYTE